VGRCCPLIHEREQSLPFVQCCIAADPGLALELSKPLMLGNELLLNNSRNDTYITGIELHSSQTQARCLIFWQRNYSWLTFCSSIMYFL